MSSDFEFGKSAVEIVQVDLRMAWNSLGQAEIFVSEGSSSDFSSDPDISQQWFALFLLSFCFYLYELIIE